MNGLDILLIAAGVLIGNLLSDIITAAWVVWRTKKARAEYMAAMETAMSEGPTSAVVNEAGYR